VTNTANDTWQNNNTIGAIGQANFAASPVNSTFDIAYISHEPGALCSNPPMDCPFIDNLHACSRYFQKTYPYPTLPGTGGTDIGMISLIALPNTAAYGPFRFPQRMAKAPTITPYSYTGAINKVRNGLDATDYSVSAIYGTADAGFYGIAVTSPPTGSWTPQFQYTADTGW
jgi:hypothetical protein